MSEPFQTVQDLAKKTSLYWFGHLSFVSKTIPIGITYASFAGLAIIATVIVGVIKFNQVPNLYSVIGLVLIITGVLMVNILGNS